MIVHRRRSSGINSTMINTFRVLSHPRTRLETTIDGQLFTWMTRQRGTQRLNEIGEQRYLSSNFNLRFMVEQLYYNRYRMVRSPCPKVSVIHTSVDELSDPLDNKLIFDSIEIL